MELGMCRGYSVRGRRMRSVPGLVRRDYKPYDGPPPVGSLDAIAASKGSKPHTQSYEDMDPAVLAYMPEIIRTGSGPTSGVINPPTLSAIRAAKQLQLQLRIGRTPAQVNESEEPSQTSQGKPRSKI